MLPDCDSMGLKGWPYLARDQAKDIDSAGNLSQQWDPAHGEVPRPDTSSEAMESSQKGA